MDLLEKHRAVHSFEQFVALSTVDLRDAAHALLLDDLSRNAKVTVDAAKQTITYRVPARTALTAPHPTGRTATHH